MPSSAAGSLALGDAPSAGNGSLQLEAVRPWSGWVARELGDKLMPSVSPPALVPDQVQDAATARNHTVSVVIESLEKLNKSTEQDLLQMGGALGEFMASAAAICAALAELTKVASEDQSAVAHEALTHALSQCKEFESRNATQRICLVALQNGAVRLKHTLADLNRTAQVFQTLGILTRIEAVRLQGDGSSFSHLPDDWKHMAQSVRIRVSSALEIAANLVTPIEKW
jgi:hypothetical protein